MAKGKPKTSKRTGKESASSAGSSPPATVSALRAVPSVWYKIQVLVYDLRNLSKNRESENRLLGATEELYLGSPYLTAEETALVKAAIVDTSNNLSPEQRLDMQDDDDVELPPIETPQTVEQAIQRRLANFFEKRKASGDARPCGPHDVAPVYQSVFGMPKQELEDPRFINRLQRSGLAT